ncbi:MULTISPECIES: DUF805 domain-containing protein [unclassified Mesorhizobium]|uniref:DUF805 domain-containing protein n=1 Tax=unclassified Mesorhizobium TaxID=325217 RepID=UPI00112DD1C9|nr:MULTISPECIES: DUF805 domain-containing protein [unclassified Mesorhizobium]TPK61337.1 DUF805 domain-containing protein [Mesorhizobium sp. B2-5-1]TPM66564.1 DUF805 domain-containing protein [Mesorhizobium sp. B2-1-9]TPM89132.1 DUF805 domain-containing protein [Mesorhizobium sp. B2-1-4]TPN08866.1 DUF805 domain-containing protein [Mesorhizobium sp. B2-1-2]UCI13796.1 DUF805 domain-containing protein [Mesorhizobium sp. B2-1-1]
MDWKYLLTSFDSRIDRAKFWAGIGIFIVIGIVVFILDAILGTRFTTAGGGRIGMLVALASIYFAIALYAKRWHDRDKSGWWTLIGLGVLEGAQGVNQYGRDPLA